MSALWLGRVAASLALFSATIVAVTTGGVNQATAQNQSEWRGLFWRRFASSSAN